MIGRAFGCVVVCGCLMAGASLQAHHSLAGVYDMKAEKEIVRIKVGTAPKRVLVIEVPQD